MRSKRYQPQHILSHCGGEISQRGCEKNASLRIMFQAHDEYLKSIVKREQDAAQKLGAVSVDADNDFLIYKFWKERE